MTPLTGSPLSSMASVPERRGGDQHIRALKVPREKINGVWLAEPLLTNEEAEAQAAKRSGLK